MEEGQLHLDTKHPPQAQPREGDQIHVETSATAGLPSESLDQGETPMDAQEQTDSANQPQAKPLWKPIPPLLPESQRGTATDTRDQSCQTEEKFQQTTACNHGHNTGVFFLNLFMFCCFYSSILSLKLFVSLPWSSTARALEYGYLCVQK